MKIVRPLLAVLSVAILAARADAQSILYGTTAANTLGQLVILNPATGAVVTTVGPTSGGGNTYGITGLAYNPVNGLLYGSSGGGSNYTAATRGHLVTINPATGAVTDIGAFNVPISGNLNPMTDLAFTAAGQLYGIGAFQTANLYTINLTTGQATLVPPSGADGTVGGGLAVHPTTGVFYASPLPTSFGTIDPSTGAYTNIGAPSALPAGPTSSFASLDFNSAGVLFAANLQTGGGTASRLVTINTLSAVVTDLGPSINGLDAIVFVPVPEPGMVMLVAAPVAFVLARFRRRN